MAAVDGLVMFVAAVFLGRSIQRRDAFFAIAWAILLVVATWLFVMRISP